MPLHVPVPAYLTHALPGTYHHCYSQTSYSPVSASLAKKHFTIKGITKYRSFTGRCLNVYYRLYSESLWTSRSPGKATERSLGDCVILIVVHQNPEQVLPCYRCKFD